MAHYAFLNENNIVQKVLVGMDENDLSELPQGVSSWEEHYTNTQGMTCKRTSYNTVGNVHLLGGTAFRGNYAGIGYTYDSINDVFYTPKPYESWILDSNTWTWVAPLDLPNDANGDIGYYWDEDLHQTDSTLGWVLVT
jgi:hypothetical protein